MNYPLLSEYQEAVMSAEDNFAELSHLRPVLDTNGEAVMTSGNFAAVFKMRDKRSGRHYAVKCFLKEQEGRAEAYRQISDELEYVSSSFLTTIKYLDRELFVDSKATDETEFPVVLMDWVEGVTLDKYIRSHLSDPYSLSLLSYQFSRLAMWLLPQPFAHGDLKPDNILVKDDGTLVLVDYDGMYVPAMKGQTPRETGSPDFRHPDRREEAFDEHIDDFSLISILLSIKLIATDSSLLEKYGAADRLLFSEKDYQNISECDMLHSLFPSEDMEQNRLYSIFLMCLADRHIPVVLYKSFNINRPDLRDCNDISQLRRMALRGDSDSQYKLGRCYCEGKDVHQDYSEAVKWFSKSAEQGNAEAQCCFGCCYYKGYGVPQDYSETIRWYKKSAEQGNVRAQTGLGLCYENGRGVVKDYAEAVKWYRKSAEQGDAYAQNSLGLCYANGYGVVKDYAEAVKWFRKSAEQGDAYGQNALGLCYAKGWGVVQDYAEAVNWYRKSAEQGNAKAQCNLGVCYENGRGVVQDYAEAVKWYRKSAEQGNAKAQNSLGLCYKNGLGVVQDYAEAVNWYRKSAEQGEAAAQFNLGVCYENGRGVVQDYAEAVKWYRKSAEQGNAKAQNSLGLCYKNGRGVVKDYAEAVNWYRKSAEQGNAAAQFNLGNCYANGRGVVQDYVEAVKWYRKSAEQGEAAAQFNLGVCYYYGWGVVQDYAEAVNWYCKSAEQGDAYAQYNLGVCYENGRGVVQDYAEAVKWYRKSAEQGNEGAKKNLADIESKHQQDELVFTAHGVAFKMIRVDGGTFKMGATPEQGDYDIDWEKPVHDVTLSSYYIAETQVTQELWQAVMGSNPSYFTGNLQRPVECVSWHDFQEFIKKLNQLTGKTFRLPTEAEWEYAARGGNKSRGYKYAGSNTLDDVAWYDGNSGGVTTHPVKQKQANELGLYDMSGNVWDWCQDWYNRTYYLSSPQTNPAGPSDGVRRVLRGGSWCDLARDCRVSCRYNGNPVSRCNYFGFRLVLPVNNA